MSEQECYEIRIKGRIDQRWAAWFDGLTVTNTNSGETVLAGPVTDQTALHGLLAKVRDLNLPLVSVRRIESEIQPCEGVQTFARGGE
jgi:hypothetical protein